MATDRIRDLNDAFRKTGPTARGGWLITPGVEALGAEHVAAAIRRVITFDTFTSDNDPHGEHDFGRFEHHGEIIYWKIDYYDLELKYGSPDPANPDLTRRVLTILLASEY